MHVLGNAIREITVAGVEEDNSGTAELLPVGVRLVHVPLFHVFVIAGEIKPFPLGVNEAHQVVDVKDADVGP